jgi:hypothetical protein
MNIFLWFACTSALLGAFIAFVKYKINSMDASQPKWNERRCQIAVKKNNELHAELCKLNQ